MSKQNIQILTKHSKTLSISNEIILQNRKELCVPSYSRNENSLDSLKPSDAYMRP